MSAAAWILGGIFVTSLLSLCAYVCWDIWDDLTWRRRHR